MTLITAATGLTLDSDTMRSACFGRLSALKRLKISKPGASLKGLYENNRC